MKVTLPCNHHIELLYFFCKYAPTLSHFIYILARISNMCPKCTNECIYAQFCSHKVITAEKDYKQTFTSRHMNHFT